jgi:hypothetical protein
LLHNYKENTNVEQEWDNIKNTLRKTTEESLGNVTVTHNRGYLNICNNEIKEINKENKIAYRI